MKVGFIGGGNMASAMIGGMIRGFVPLAEMFGYATDLRSKTQGRGNYSMFFDKYEQVPKNVQEKVLSAKAK